MGLPGGRTQVVKMPSDRSPYNTAGTEPRVRGIMTSADDILSLAQPKADLRVAYGGDQNQFIDLRLPKGKGPHALVITIHGGFWRAKYDLGYAGHLCAALTAKGMAPENWGNRGGGEGGGGG